MLIPKPTFLYYRDSRVFGEHYNIYNCFGLGTYITKIKYSRWISKGVSHEFSRLLNHSLTGETMHVFKR
jgi:hypothetical protein